MKFSDVDRGAKRQATPGFRTMNNRPERRHRYVPGSINIFRVIVILAIACTALGSGELVLAQAKKPDTSRDKAQDVTVVARPILNFDRLNASKTEFGKLEWIGGLVLSSSDNRFGGWSGIAIDPDGRRFIAVSDAGSWMTADLDYARGRPQKIVNARIGPLKAKSGGRLVRGRDRDAEAVAILDGSVDRGRVVIAFEGNHRLGVFKTSKAGVAKPGYYIKIPSAARRMRIGKGFEAVAEIKAGPNRGALVAISEGLPDKNRNHTGWIMSRGKAASFGYSDIGGFDPTDAVGLPNGDLIVLERRFRWTEGVKMRLRRVPTGELRSGRVVHGEVLMEANMGQDIDNMEALTAHRAADGSTILTLMSDDNFNTFLQRTILLQFRLRAVQT
ncbi:MAG: esterase-like activity of phytase family protein [Hyphomicrobiaceae bacterium]|nr:esterase-like activity of phytase family protein [Hyphomicrobiaceae bacterium]MCC0009146.1 esterase-like activity of phytase family protein [Hyphomicrobiaceae bacterium]